MRVWVLLLCGLLVVGTAAGQVKTEAQLDAEAREADTLYNNAQTLASLPLYQDLHERRPKVPFYTVRLSMAIVARGGASGSAEAQRKDNETALALLQEAKKGGGAGDLIEIMIAKLTASLNAPQVASPTTGPRAKDGSFEKAELLFNQGNLQAAAVQYKKSAEEFPKFYAAPLYAGDSEYKLGHYDEAGVWFRRAIAIDDNTETAHRYWADCLLKSGKPMEARNQYLLAYVGDPYDKAPRLELISYAKSHQERWQPPVIALPARPTRGSNGNINITMDANKMDDPMSSAWLMYNMNSASWQGDKFKKEYPKENEYRHSLAEEMDGLRLVLVTLHESKTPENKLDVTAKTLLALDKDGMLACWVLLDHPDNGLAQDYEQFRADHKDLLLKYVQKYDLHPG